MFIGSFIERRYSDFQIIHKIIFFLYNSDFHLEDFFDKFNIPNTNALSQDAIALLENELGLSRFLPEEQCAVGRPPFLDMGWNSGKNVKGNTSSVYC